MTLRREHAGLAIMLPNVHLADDNIAAIEAAGHISLSADDR